MLTLMLGIGQIWATDPVEVEVTIYASSGDYYAKTHNWQNNGAQVYDQVVLDDNITVNRIGTGNNGKFYSDWRFYTNGSNNGSFSVDAANGATLSSVKFTYTVSNSGALYFGSTKLTSNTAQSISGTQAVFQCKNTNTSSNGQVRLTKVLVTYIPAETSSCDKKVSIKKGTPSNGAFNLDKTGEKDCCEALTVTVTNITPEEGYEFGEITQSGITSGVTIDQNAKTVTYAANTTGESEINVTFTELPKYTVSFNVGGSTDTQDPISETLGGQGITLPVGPTPTCSGDGWTFAGWKETSAVDVETTTAPTLLLAGANYKPAANCTLYAVYKRTEGGSGAAVGTTLFSEAFSSYSAGDVPSGSVTTATGRVVYGNANVTYTSTNGGSDTKIYNENTGGGTAPEILVGKSTGSFAIAGIPSGNAKSITVSWTQNKQELSVAPTGTGYSGSLSGKPDAVGTRTFDITVADGADATFTLTFAATGSSNVRVDDISVVVATASGTTYYLSAPTCTAPEPTVETDPTSVAFGTVYQHSTVSPIEVTISGENLTADLTAVSSNTDVFTVAVKEGDSLTPTDGAVLASLVITPNTTTAGEFTDTKISISGGGLADAVEVPVTMTVTPTYAITAASVTGGSFSWEDDQSNANPAYVAAGTVIQAAANNATGYTFEAFDIYKTGEATTKVDHTDGLFEMPAYAVTIGGSFTENKIPEITLSQTEDYLFDDVAKGGSTSMTFTVSAAYLSNNITVAVSGTDAAKFGLSTTSITISEGGVENAEVTITPVTTEVGTFEATITVDDGEEGAAAKSFGVMIEVLETYTAKWIVNGNELTESAQTAVAGTALTFPENPSATGDCAGLVFRGWLTSELAEASATAPEGLITETEGLTMPSNDINYYAVFAEENITEQEGDPEWVEITAVPTAGTYAICSADYFMTASINKSRFQNSDATPSIENGKLTVAPANDLLWDISINDDGKFLIKHGTDGYAAGTGSNNNIKLEADATTTSAQWTITYSNGFVVENVGNKASSKNATLRNNGDYGWACYAASTGAAPRLFKYTPGEKTQTTTYSGYLTTCPSCADLALNGVVDGGNGSIALQVGGKDVTSVKTCDPVVVDVVATPDPGYELDDIELSGVANATYDAGVITIPQNAEGTLTVTASFAAVNYTVAVAQTGGAGSELSGATDAAHYNEEITVSATAVDGYYFIGWEATGITLENAQALSQTFNMPANNVSLTAKFAEILTVAEAVDLIKTSSTASNKVVEGYISEVGSYNSTYHSITYYLEDIDTNGFLSDANVIKVYSGKGLDNANFSSADDIEVGAKVRVLGDLLFYDPDYEINYNNYQLSYVAPENPSVEIYGTAAKTAYEVGDSFDFDGLSAKTVYDNDYATAIENPTWVAVPATIAATTTSVSVTANGEGAKNIDITVLTHELSISATNGTVVVKYQGAAVEDGDHFVKGDELTITATPASADYALTSLTVNGDAFVSGNTYEVGTVNIAVEATFTEKSAAGISWSESAVNVTLGDTYVLPTLNNPNSLMVELSSTNEAVAYLDEGQIKIAGAGETTISAEFAGNDTYKASTVSYTLTVANPASYSLKNNWNGGEWDWAVMTYAGDGKYILENVVFGGTGVNWRQGDSGDGTWVELASFEGDNIQAWDNVTLALDPSAGTITATLNSRAVVEFGGSWTQDWSEGKITAVVSTDKTYAAVKKELTKGEWYNFKPVVGGHWLGCSAGATEINRTSNSVNGFVYEDDNNHIYFKADVTGEYEFKWVYTTNTVIVTFPDHTYTVAWSLNDGADEALGELEKMGDSDIFAKYFDKEILAVGTYVVKVFQDEETTPITTANLAISEVAKYYVEFDYDASKNKLSATASNPRTPTGVDNTGDGQKAVKVMKDNTIYIIRGDKTYTITGQVVK